MTALFPAVQSAASILIDLVFPPRCARCGRVDTPWCEVCAADLMAVPVQPVTGEQTGFRDVVSSGVHAGILQEAVQALKYHNTGAVADPLGARLATALLSLNWTFDMIIPVPLHPDRLRLRGYNQAQRIAESLATVIQVVCVPQALQRVRHTRTQVGLNRAQRLTNMTDAFLADSGVVRGKTLLIVDDVRTTGATLTACALAAQQAGATAVYGATVTVAQPA